MDITNPNETEVPGAEISRVTELISRALQEAGYGTERLAYPIGTIAFLGADHPDSQFGLSITINITE